MSEKLHIETKTITAGMQYSFVAYRDCVVDLMVTAPNSPDVKTVIVSVDGISCEMSLTKGVICRFDDIKLQHMHMLVIQHGPLNNGQPFTVRLTEVAL